MARAVAVVGKAEGFATGVTGGGMLSRCMSTCYAGPLADTWHNRYHRATVSKRHQRAVLVVD
jgi:hypothetical protein